MRHFIIRFLEFILAKAKTDIAARLPEPVKASAEQPEVVQAVPEPQIIEAKAAEPVQPPRRPVASARRSFVKPQQRRKTRWLSMWRAGSVSSAGAPPSLELRMEAHQPPPGTDPISWTLERAKLRLTKTEFLLLEPNPDAIQQATFQVEEVAALIARVERGLENDRSLTRRMPYVATMLDLCQQLKRVRRLLDGAKRMQWARIRWIGSIVQTYTAAGKTRLWNPAPRTWTCEM